MRKEIYVPVIGTLFIVFMFFLFFNDNLVFTGYAVSNNSNNLDINNNFKENFDLNSTRDTVLKAFDESEIIILEMLENNFSITYINDSLIEARRVLRQVDYAQILRSNNSNSALKNEAKNALSLIDWSSINYSTVFNYTNDIKLRREQAFRIYDTLRITEASLERYKSRGILLPGAEQLFESSKTAFYDDRYSEAEDLLKQTRESIDSNGAEASLLGDLKRSIIGFIQRYLLYILIILFVLLIVGYLVYKRIIRKLLRQKIRKMKAEKEALVELTKKSQEERFKSNKISNFTYNIRLKKYQEKISKIEEELPILEDRLKNLKK